MREAHNAGGPRARRNGARTDTLFLPLPRRDLAAGPDAQYRTLRNILERDGLQIPQFVEQYSVQCPYAEARFAIGVPATLEHGLRRASGIEDLRKDVAVNFSRGRSTWTLLAFAGGRRRPPMRLQWGR